MKKVLIGMISAVMTVSSYAGNITDITGNERDRQIPELIEAVHQLATGGTLTNTLTVAKTLTVSAGDIVATAGKVTSYGYSAPVSSSASQVFMLQTGTNNITTLTNTFTVSYIANPIIMWGAPAGGVTVTNVITVSSNKFVVAATPPDATWFAYGRIK